MPHRLCAWTLAIVGLCSGLTTLGAQGTPAPAVGMAVRWSDVDGPHAGKITSIMPDGSFVADLFDKGGLPLAYAVAVDPKTTPGLEVRVARVSHRTLGALIGGVAGIMGARVYLDSRSTSCGSIDVYSCVIGGFAWRLALGTGALITGIEVGARIAGVHSTWVPASAGPVKDDQGATLRPLLTWHDGPSVGLRVRF